MPRSTSTPAALALVAAAALGGGCDPASSPRAASVGLGDPGTLRAPEVFSRIEDRDTRARALFAEAGKVILHARCTNCHPAGDVPLQGDSGLLHDPPVFRGDDDRGVPGLTCAGCHQDRNLEHARVPGAPEWHLAPLSMAWVGRPLGSICEQLKDPARNGGKTLAQIVEHTAHDPLVAWGWAPGSERTTPPGDQARFGALMKAWADAGAACPPPEER